jgi:hypothetical protein
MTIICVREQCQYDRNGVCNNECLINPDYLKLAQIAYDMVLQTMIEGEKEHGADEWKSMSIIDHGEHAYDHTRNFLNGKAFKEMETGEDNIAHAMTCCAIIKYLEVNPYDKAYIKRPSG